MKKYIFDYSFDRKSVTDQQIFDFETDAVSAAENYFSRLTPSEKKDLLRFDVYEAEVTPEQAAEIAENGISGDMEMDIWRREILKKA